MVTNINATSETFSIADEVPDYQNVLHTAAGLTTKANLYPNGCKASMLGVPGQPAVSLGTNSKGDLVGAYIDPVSGEVQIVTANISGGYWTQAAVPSIPGPKALAAADLKGDGNLDLVAAASGGASGSAGVYVMLSNGDGTFASPVAYNTGGYVPNSVTVDDVNGDGKLDLLEVGKAAGTATAGVQVLLGNGDGTFQPALVSGGVDGIQSLATGNFNGDGKKDIVLSTGQILLGNGDGTFAPPSATLPIQLTPVQGVQDQDTPVVADFNNDGKQDVAMFSLDGVVTIFLGHGNGTFSTGASYATIYDGATNLEAADLDGDGNVDLVIGAGGGGYFGPDFHTNGAFEVLMGHGDGTFFAPPAFPGVTSSGSDNTALPGTLFATGDFNGDGNIDILGTTSWAPGSGAKGLVVLEGNGKGNFSAGPVSAEPAPTLLAAADMNGDGKLDAVYADQGGAEVGVALGNGDGTFQTGTDYPLPSGITATYIALADLNGDGKPDVVVAGTNSSLNGVLYAFLNNGDGTLAAPVLIDSFSGTPGGLAIADLNGDGKADIALTSGLLGGPGQVRVYLGKGDGSFQTAVAYPAGQDPSGLAIGDMNRDGKPDLVFLTNDQNQQGHIDVMLGNGDGTFAAAVASPPLQQGAEIGNLAIADVNGDGNLDVLVSGSTYASISLGNGDGTLQPDGVVEGIASPTDIVAADVTGDRRPDIIFSAAPNTAAIVLNPGPAASGPGTEATTTTLSAAPNPVTAGQTLTLTATVTASGSGTPTGTISFMDGTTTLASEALASGAAAYSTGSLSVGAHSITAVYGGDTTFTGSTSGAVTVTVQAAPAPTFTITDSPSSATVAAGQSAQSTVTVTPANGFNQQVSFSCSGLPNGGSCAFSPPTATPNGAADSTTLTIATAASQSYAPPWPWLSWPWQSGSTAPFEGAAGLAALAAALWLLTRERKRGLRTRLLLGLICVLAIAATSTACGGGTSSSGSRNNPPAQNYTITITGTAGSESQTATFALTVK